jgi:ABC-type lipoprotein release transport system permease subunit
VLVLAVSVLLAGASLAALFVPARSATRVDPASTLRGE